MHSQEIQFEQHDLLLPDERVLKIWITHTAPAQAAPPQQVVVLASGFGRHMYHNAYLAYYLALNGFKVYRYDSLDHVGMSHGEIEDFSMGVGLASLQHAIAFACEREAQQSVGIVSNSLSTRIAIKAASRFAQVRYLVFGVGVVNLRRTLNKVFDIDIGGPYYDIPEYVFFEKHRIARDAFVPELKEGGWLELDSTIADLKQVQQPVVGLVGETDEWVDAGEVERAMSEGVAGPRKLLHLKNASHEIGRNARIAREFLKVLTMETMQCAGLDPSGPVNEPLFEEMVQRGISERRILRSFAEE